MAGGDIAGKSEGAAAAEGGRACFGKNIKLGTRKPRRFHWPRARKDGVRVRSQCRLALITGPSMPMIRQYGSWTMLELFSSLALDELPDGR
jgi:hypothetical protein